MDDFAERIRASVENPNSDPWFPELTDELTAWEWDRLHRRIGLTADNYGTARILSRSLSAPRNIIKSLKTSPTVRAPTIAIEAVQEWAEPYCSAGLNFYSPSEILNSTMLTCLENALVIISQVPSLMTTVNALVRSVHVIKPADRDHDTSFSEPHIPFSIFVSVPQERIANDALRAAEAIVHEAMHLQLTLVQYITPLFRPTANKYYSPWRGELRDAEGVLHGLYVFKTIHDFFRALNNASLDAIEKKVIRGRQVRIRNQISNVRDLRDSKALTYTGARFVQWLTDSELGEMYSYTSQSL